MKDSAHLGLIIPEGIYFIDGDVTPLEEEQEVIASSEASLRQPLVYAGENKTGVLVIVSYPADTPISSSDISLLTKILQAVKIDLSDSLLLNTQENASFSVERLQELNVTKIIDFTAVLSPSGVKYQLSSVATQKVLASDPLHALNDNAGLKKQLWAQLKLMFQ